MIKKIFIIAVLAVAVLSGCSRPEPNETAAMLEQQAKAGNAEAMYSLFLVTYMDAKRYPLTDAERKRGLEWLEKAAKLGNWRAAFTLAEAYKHGTFGYPKSQKDEVYWRDIYETNRPKTAA